MAVFRGVGDLFRLGHAKTHALAEQAIQDLRVLVAASAREEHGGVPAPGRTYLHANAEVLHFLLRQVYAKSDAKQRERLQEAHRELDRAAIAEGFQDLAVEVIGKAKQYTAAYDVRYDFAPLDEDTLRMLLRAVQYARYLKLDACDGALKFSPIARHGVRDHLPGPHAARAETPGRDINWKAADDLYLAEKADAFAACRSLGLNLEEREERPDVADISTNLPRAVHRLSRLVKTKADCDVALVTLAAPQEKDALLPLLEQRLSSEFLDLLDQARQAIRHVLAFLAPLYFKDLNVGDSLSHVQKQTLELKTEELLEPFKTDARRIQENMAKAVPRAEIMERISRGGVPAVNAPAAESPVETITRALWQRATKYGVAKHIAYVVVGLGILAFIVAQVDVFAKIKGWFVAAPTPATHDEITSLNEWVLKLSAANSEAEAEKDRSALLGYARAYGGKSPTGNPVWKNDIRVVRDIQPKGKWLVVMDMYPGASSRQCMAEGKAEMLAGLAQKQAAAPSHGASSAEDGIRRYLGSAEPLCYDMARFEASYGAIAGGADLRRPRSLGSCDRKLFRPATAKCTDVYEATDVDEAARQRQPRVPAGLLSP